MRPSRKTVVHRYLTYNYGGQKQFTVCVPFGVFGNIGTF